jgi:hypothetical protein
MKCTLCGSERLRPSRLHRPDLLHLFSFSYPVRCAVCYERMFVNLYDAFRIHRKANERKLAAREARQSAPQTKPNGA